MAIEAARSDDLPAIIALLERDGLPRAEIEQHVDATVVARDRDRLVGCAAVEVYDANGLLRSVAVDPQYQGQGLGIKLTEAALALARTRGVRTLYLLTETAATFFPRFGFRALDRESVAAAVRRSVEFTSACPASAQAMVAELLP